MAKRLKILIELTPDIVGGAETFLCRLAGHLNRRRFEPVMLCWKKGPATDWAKRHGLKVIVFDYLSKARQPETVKMLKAGKFDLVQSNTFAMPLALAARAAGIPLLWRLGGHVEVVMADKGAERREEFLQWAKLLSDSLICPTQFLASQFNEHARQVQIISNGVDTKAIRPTKKKKDAVPRIVMVAHLLPQKRHLDLIRAAGILKRKGQAFRLFFMGKRYPNQEGVRYVAQLKKEVDRLDLSDHVVWCEGGMDRFDFLSTCDLLVLPSLKEGSSNAIIEAMALGIPVVTTESGGNAELVVHGKTGLVVPPRTPSALAEAMLKILSSELKWKAMATSARARAVKNFEVRRTAHEYERLYLSHI